jgi:hypothetical protein
MAVVEVGPAVRDDDGPSLSDRSRMQRRAADRSALPGRAWGSAAGWGGDASTAMRK